jgi:hypothetical protein
MSRFVSINTRLRDREILQQCLEHLNCQVLYEEQGIKMRGAHTPVQLLVHASFGTLGFRAATAGEYEIVGMEEVIEGQKEFINKLTQQYAYRKILKDTSAAGYNLVQEEVGEDKTIKLVVRKW